MGGFVFDVVGGCVSWSLKKQVSVATSSVEAEYVASANATKEVVWLRMLLKEVGYCKGNQSGVDSRRILSNITLLNMLQLTSRRILRD